jgi:hypothetical protein
MILLPSSSFGFGRGSADVLPITLNPVTTNLIGSYEMFQTATRDLSSNTLRDSTTGINHLSIQGSNAYSFDAGGSLVLNVDQTNYNQQNWLRILDFDKRQDFNPWVSVPNSFTFLPRPRTYVFWAALNANPNRTANRNRLLDIGHSSNIALKERISFEYDNGLSRFFAAWSDNTASSFVINNGSYRDNVMRMYTVTFDGANQKVYTSVNGVVNDPGSVDWFGQIFPSNTASSSVDGAEFMVNLNDQSGVYGQQTTPMRIGAIYVYNEALSSATITNLYNQTRTLVGT